MSVADPATVGDAIEGLERKLESLSVRFGAVGVKAEFEAEAAYLQEVALLADIARAAGLRMTLKIGGPEARSDIREASIMGIDRVVAPLIESAFAVQKFLSAIEGVPVGDPWSPELAINVESRAGLNCVNEIVRAAAGSVTSMVIGRTDLLASMGQPISHVDDLSLIPLLEPALKSAADAGMECSIGGTLSFRSLPLLAELGNFVSTAETRKVIFPIEVLLGKDGRMALAAAMEFEQAWLEYRLAAFGPARQDDLSRVQILKLRSN